MALKEQASSSDIYSVLCYSPHVNGRGVLCGAQQHIRWPIPKGYHLIGIGLGGNGLGPCQTWRAKGLTKWIFKFVSANLGIFALIYLHCVLMKFLHRKKKDKMVPLSSH